MQYDVVIAGAGPVGLLLACELSLAGVQVLVLEKLADPNLPIKAGAVGARALNVASIEFFYRRGMLTELRNAAISWRELPDSPEFANRGPAAAQATISMQSLEALLSARASALGVEVRCGIAVQDFVADEDGVNVRAGDHTFRSRWLVGCDGGRSTVRKLAGFEFPGTDPGICGYSAEVEIADADKLHSGWNRNRRGLYVLGPMAGRILIVRFDGPPEDRDAPVTLKELQANLREVSDTTVTLTAVHAATRWTDNMRQASTYRLGRVLLAGDAAHVIVPLGGEGLNLGLGDAANLGWKLASVVKGWTPETLLDTYTTERHPIAKSALEWTRAQIALMRPDRRLTAEMRQVAGFGKRRELAEKVSGVWHRHAHAGDHPLIGRSAPDLQFDDGTTLALHCHTGSAVLFAFREIPDIEAISARWADRLIVVRTTLKGSPRLSALLLRPDGFVAWAADGSATLRAAAPALDALLGVHL